MAEDRKARYHESKNGRHKTGKTWWEATAGKGCKGMDGTKKDNTEIKRHDEE